MADVIARAERRFHVGAVVRIDIDGIVRALALGRVDELADDGVAVRAAGILGADGYLPFRAGKAVAHAAHVDADGFRHTLRHGGRTAEANLFIDGHMDIRAARQRLLFGMQVFCKAEQNTDGELIVEETAFDVARSRHVRARVEADDIACLNAERTRLFGRRNILVQQDLGRVEGSVRLGVFAVDVDRGVAELERPLIDLAGARIDAHIFRFAIFCAHTAEARHAQAAIGLDLRDHRAERVRVRLQKQPALCGLLTAEIDQNAALGRFPCVKAERCKSLQHPFGRFVRKARRAVDCKQLDGFFYCILRITLFHCFRFPF